MLETLKILLFYFLLFCNVDNVERKVVFDLVDLLFSFTLLITSRGDPLPSLILALSCSKDG